MKLLKSIEKVEENQVYKTGCKPFLVHCNDLNFYVCKYNKTTGAANKLFREYLAAAFLKIWHLAVPEFNLVKLEKDHIPILPYLGRINFDCPCFGSLYGRYFKEVDNFLTELTHSQQIRFGWPEDYLTIAFFDLWISNNDRHPGNYNLLLSPENNSYRFIPIDHESCFHTGNYEKENYIISLDESLLSSPILRKLCKLSLLQDIEYFASIKSKWYLYMQNCFASLPAILHSVPEEWQIQSDIVENQIKNFMFSDEWFEKCWKTFLEYIQLTINKG